MKIIHICLAAAYVEGFGYQENILPQLHALSGNTVFVFTSEFTFDKHYQRMKRESMDYINQFGVHVTAFPKSKRYGFYSKFGDFDGVYNAIADVKPDIIFVHGGQFVALMDVIRYCKRHPNVRLYIDQHGDYYNSPVNTWKTRFVHRYIFGHWMRKAAKYASKFWGVTPWRCQYLREVYKLPQEKIDLLVMGGNDENIHFDQLPALRTELRQALSLAEDDFVLVTGGKIDRTKNIHLLMQAVSELNTDKIKLIVFGQPSQDFEAEFLALAEDSHIRYVGWIESAKAYDYFLSGDLAVFPGTHSVLWEQVCACGVPALFKDWEGMHHVDVGGNCLFLTEDSVDEIKAAVWDLYQNQEKYQSMKHAAKSGIEIFSYENIARRAIGGS